MNFTHQISKFTIKRTHCLKTHKVATADSINNLSILNCKYSTDTFNSQILLWPGEEDAEWLADFPDAKASILTLRKSILTAALGRNCENATCVLERIFLPCFEFATELRARYDPEYCDGSLDHVGTHTGQSITDNLVADLETHGYGQGEIARSRRYVGRVEQEQAAFGAYLSARHRAILSDGPALRAVKIAFHINKNGLKKAFQATDMPDRQTVLDREIEQAVSEAASYSERLVALRLHHRLTLLQLDGYKALARRLVYEPDRVA